MGSENAGTFQSNVHIIPRQCLRVAFRCHANGAASHIDGVAFDLYFAWKFLVHAIKLQKVRIGLDGCEIIDCHNFNIGASGFDDGAGDVAANPAKSVNSNFDSHGASLNFMLTQLGEI